MSNPTLRFNGQLLEPYDVQRTENGWHLYYTPGTTIPANPTTWPEQLRGQGWRQVRCGVEPDGSVLVIVERL